MNTRHIFRAGALALVLALVSCAGGGAETAIRKVQIFHLKSPRPAASKDYLISSETKKRMWGAISNQERADRMGNYYTVHWKTPDTATPVVVRFEYRQANTGSKLFTQEQAYPNPGRSNKTEFTVTGEAYHTQGRVVAWRVQVIQGGQVIGEETSFLWD
jgi:hypothetical protein